MSSAVGAVVEAPPASRRPAPATRSRGSRCGARCRPPASSSGRSRSSSTGGASYGETFRASLFGPGDVVFVSDPASIKRLFAADRVNTIAPGRNIILEPLLGSGRCCSRRAPSTCGAGS